MGVAIAKAAKRGSALLSQPGLGFLTPALLLGLIHELHGSEILRSCASSCNPSYLPTLYKVVGLPLVPPSLKEVVLIRRRIVWLLLTVALLMAAMIVATAIPVFAAASENAAV